MKSAEKYLFDARNRLNDILIQVNQKKKTTKYKAAKRMCEFLKRRIDGLIEITQTGGSAKDASVAGDEILYRGMFEDIILFWEEDLKK